MASWMNLGQILKVNARKFPNTVALKDQTRQFTFPELNVRVNKLADSLLNLGLQKGDKVAVLMENSIEIVEIFLATAKTGLIIVPINFRLVGQEVSYIVNNSDARALIVHDEFAPVVRKIRAELSNIKADNYFVVGEPQENFKPYETLITQGSADEPDAVVKPEDIWILIYTSGTTG
jgi:acyl-CoA synthetase (AMP-forming)/AMP-acid ligase II